MKFFELYILLIFVLSLSSCGKDFLDVNNTQNLYRESYVKDLSTMQEFLNGTYVLLSSKVESGPISSYSELVADNIRPLSASSYTSMSAHYNWAQKPNGINGMDELWLSGYTIIRACNFVLEDIDKFRKESPEKADNIKGQAYALRAYVSFKLVNTFAQSYNFTENASHPGIPYITTSDITKSFSRQTVSEVYTSMIADLNNALQLLPDAINDVRYLNQLAVKTLLARIYLFKEDFASAQKLAIEVSNQTPLTSINNGYPDIIYKIGYPNKTEVLFQLSPYDGQYGTTFLNYFFRSSSKEFLATNDIASLLKENPNDVRHTWVTELSGEWNVTKFPIDAAPDVTPKITIPEIAYYPAIFRSSEMFLTVAEASAKMGDEVTARNYIDEIRKRADPSLPSITAAGTALLDSIYKERRKELAFEGLRIHDLLRWKKGVSRTDVLPGSPATLSYPNNKAISPLPNQDVTFAGLSQNKGY